MKNILFYIVAMIASLFLFSCEDVIELDLKDTEPRIVIEANIDGTSQEVAARITFTNGFYDTSDQITVDDATITLTDENNNSVEIPSVGMGLYKLENYMAEEQESYRLEVAVGSDIYTASTISPSIVPLMEIDSVKFESPFGGAPVGYRVFGSWMDPADQDNYYRVRSYVNDTLQQGELSVYNDRFFNGELFLIPLMSFLDLGTKVTYELRSIDEESYNYFEEITESDSGGLGGSVPFNPQGNFDNSALGYFGVFFSTELSLDL